MPRKRKNSEAEADDALSQGQGPGASASEAIDLIRYWHRQRCFAMEQRKRCDLAMGAFLRVQLGWSRELPERERARIAREAAKLMDEPAGSEWGAVISASQAARAPFAAIEKRAVREMEQIAGSLPVWPAFGEAVRGFGTLSLAVILGEAGDLSGYANPGKLWKRMGLAVFDGKRQGGLPKNASAEQWIEHGYNRQRRSRMWNIGDALIKGNRDGEYRTIYLTRKQYEIDRDPEMKPIRAHRRAQRYMEKRLLRNLWRAWRAATRTLQSENEMPPASLSATTAEPQATARVSPNARAPAATLSADEAERRAKHEATSIGLLPAAPIPARKAGRPAGVPLKPKADVPGAQLPGGQHA